MNRDTPLWRTAPPLWRSVGAGIDFERPAILRFAGDDFMEQLQAVLAAGGANLGDLVAADETWREPKAGLAAAAASPGPVRLYQPVHGRFYLLSAGLVCARYLFPDKRIDAGQGHSVFFVLRQLRPARPGVAVDTGDPSTYIEWAWVPADNAGAWTLAPAVGLAGAEQRQPLFALAYQDGSTPRRLLAGLLPVSARELLEAGPPRLPEPDDTSDDPMGAVSDPRLGSLTAVVAGLQALRSAAGLPRLPIGQLQESLFFALVELAQFLQDNLKPVWDEMPQLPGQRNLLDLLQAQNGFRLGRTWLGALKMAAAVGPGAAAGGGAPNPVTGLGAAAIRRAIDSIKIEPSLPGNGVDPPETTLLKVDPPETTLFKMVAAALPAPVAGSAAGAETAEPRAVRAAAAQAVAAPAGGFLYVARCVFERPRCPEPERLRISRPSRPFVLAPFYDPDAPYRPARIPTPVDTSLEGLRKHPKSVAVTISKQLREQMERIEGIRLSDLDSGGIPAGHAASFGMVCQLSIPIITICALILLMIIVGLLNIVFFWLPFFKICLPTVEAE